MSSAIALDAPRFANDYAAKEASYFHGVRTDFIDLLAPDGASSVLEIGCGDGATGALARQQGRCSRYVGVELCEGPAATARTRLDEVLVGDVETIDLPWQEQTFDALLMSEVLEHLAEPWAVLERLRLLMKPGAVILASSPNISHWRVIAELLKGRFDLADKGVLTARTCAGSRRAPSRRCSKTQALKSLM